MGRLSVLWRRAGLLAVASLLMASVVSDTVGAISVKQKNIMGPLRIGYYNEQFDEVCTTAATPGGAGGAVNTDVDPTLTGADNGWKAYNFFVNNGFSPLHAAAMTGNLHWESGGVNPASRQGGGGPGRGIAQWSVDDRWVTLQEFSSERGLDHMTLGAQLQFVLKEMKEDDFNNAYTEMLATTTMTDAIKVITDKYEIAGDKRYAEREERALVYLDGQQGGGITPTPGGTLVQAASGCSSSPGGAGNVSGDCTGGVNLPVPPGGTGINTCYFNQSDLEGGNYNWGRCGCGPTSSLIIRATMERNPALSNVEVLEGARAAGAIVDNCPSQVDGHVRYLSSLGYQTEWIARRGTPITDATLEILKAKLNEGFLIYAHTSVSVDSAGTNSTDGHFLILHAVDAQGNFYAANPAARADNNKPISPDRIKAWLDEFWVAKK